MLAKSVLLIATAALAAATPLGARNMHHNSNSGKSCPSKGPTPQLPKTEGDKQLSGPPEGTKLKRIAMGYGIQNYTCADSGANATATGAIAALFDITHLYPGQGKDSLPTEEAFNRLSGQILEGPFTPPLNFDKTLKNRVPKAHEGVSATDPFLPEAPLKLESLGLELPHTGHHFFTDKGVPAFKLDGGLSIFGKKLEDVPAPKAPASSPGPDETGAVAWLFLGAVEGSEGLEAVYRVETAGGNSHGCKDAPADSSDTTLYAAQYWFFGDA